MNYSGELTTPVELTIAPQTQTGWVQTLKTAGWRAFVRAGHASDDLSTWILKRGASCVMFKQGARTSLAQTVNIPTAHASDLCGLLIRAGIARPGSPSTDS